MSANEAESPGALKDTLDTIYKSITYRQQDEYPKWKNPLHHDAISQRGQRFRMSQLKTPPNCIHGSRNLSLLSAHAGF